jgi:hypothetical protein
MSDGKISLYFSCPENLGSLISTKEGFSCKCCPNAVLDLRTKSVKEIRLLAKSSDKKICGVFHTNQLNKQFVKLAALSFVICSSGLTLQAQTESASAIPPPPDVHTTVGVVIPAGLVRAEPILGYEKFLAEVGKKLNIPNQLNESGTIYIELTVDETGLVKDPKVLRGINTKTDSKIIEALTPFNQNFHLAKDISGKNVVDFFILKIAISADDETVSKIEISVSSSY